MDKVWFWLLLFAKSIKEWQKPQTVWKYYDFELHVSFAGYVPQEDAIANQVKHNKYRYTLLTTEAKWEMWKITLSK